MNLFLELGIGGLLIIITFVMQAICFDRILKYSPFIERKAIIFFKPFWKSIVFIAMISSVSFVIILEIWMWALFYLSVNVVPDLETALYFSTATFTTVGYGDIYLDKGWRMLGSIESMNGLLLFGWATAFIWEYISRLYKPEGKALEY